MPLKEALQDKKVGPRPISMVEYRERKGHLTNKEIQTVLQQNLGKKQKGGVAAKRAADIKNYYRLLNIATKAEEKILFKQEIARLRREQRQQKKKNQKKNKNFNDEVNNMFNYRRKTIKKKKNKKKN